MTMIAKRTVCQELQAGNLRITIQRRFRRAASRSTGSALAKPLVLYYSLAMRSLVFIAAFVVAGCSKKPEPAPAPEREERVYVSDEDGGNVIVISTASDAVLARIPVG